MDAYQTILVERKDAVGIITLNRPEKLNAMQQALLCEIIIAADNAVLGFIGPKAGGVRPPPPLTPVNSSGINAFSRFGGISILFKKTDS